MTDLDSLYAELMGGIEFPSEVPDRPLYNPSLTQQPIDAIERVSVRFNRGHGLSFITQVESRLSGKKYKQSAFIKQNASANTAIEDGLKSFESTHVDRDDNLDYSELWIKRDLQVKIAPYGYRKDAIVATLWYRFLPSTEWLKLGVLKLSAKKVYFSSIELNYIQPEIRIRILLLLKTQGLIPNDVVKDANCSEKTQTILVSQQLQDRLNMTFQPGSNPTIAYTLLKDDRQKKPSEYKERPDSIDKKEFSKKVSTLQNEVIKARNKATQADKALVRANLDADRYQMERDALLADKPRDRVMPQTKGKRYDLSRLT